VTEEWSGQAGWPAPSSRSHSGARMEAGFTGATGDGRASPGREHGTRRQGMIRNRSEPSQSSGSVSGPDGSRLPLRHTVATANQHETVESGGSLQGSPNEKPLCMRVKEIRRPGKRLRPGKASQASNLPARLENSADR
jgi:hypothetical protein